MILRHKNDQYQCLWWQLAAYFAKKSAKNDWFVWLCSNLHTVHLVSEMRKEANMFYVKLF